MNANGIFRAHQLGMNRRFLKTSLVTVLSSVLLYYSVAWAVLRCFDHEDETGAQTAISAGGMHHADFAPSHIEHPTAHIGCIGSNYHTETLAASSSPSQLRTLTTNIMQVTGFLALDDNAEVAIENLWLRALFDRASTLPFPTASPRYLSLSVLRI
jgi:hypothetical protein